MHKISSIRCNNLECLGPTPITRQKGAIAEGIRACETAAQLPELIPLYKAYLGVAYAQAGRIAEARSLLIELEIHTQKAYVLPSNFAQIYFALGEIEECLDWLEKAVDEQDTMLFTIHANTSMDSLHSHPRYKALLRKMNLEP